MDKNVAGLIGAMGALVAGTALGTTAGSATAQAATAGPVAVSAAMQASSYADLLKPIPNALALLKEQAPTEAESPAEIQQVEFFRHHHHHHHHHHHRRRHHHHHHHHLF